jgi:hypothetical protein
LYIPRVNGGTTICPINERRNTTPWHSHSSTEQEVTPHDLSKAFARALCRVVEQNDPGDGNKRFYNDAFKEFLVTGPD